MRSTLKKTVKTKYNLMLEHQKCLLY